MLYKILSTAWFLSTWLRLTPDRLSINNLSGEWRSHDHAKCMNEYSIRKSSYDERLNVLYYQWCDVIIHKLRSGSHCNNTGTSKQYETRELSSLFKEARTKETSE